MCSTGLAIGVLCSTSILVPSAASAAVPSFPDNIVVFPDRDFVTIEGFQDRLGQTATVEVSRPSVGIIGSAQGTVQAGDVAFEVNHPGGYCWGAGTSLKVTPDIRPGDTVSIKFGATSAGETRVQDMFVTGGSSLDGTTVTVKGHIGAGINQSQVEQRIIEPALEDTAVQRRDVRAVPGPMTPSPKGGYSSSLVFGEEGPNTFRAQYEFDDEGTAEVAANATGERAMAWEAEDADANRQGITIAEFGELGGPGMGGCPNGPLQAGPAGPTSVSAALTPAGLKIGWIPSQAVPGTPPITGYRVSAVARTSTDGEQIEIGRRISGSTARGTTITGLNPDESYDVFVVAVSSVGETFPAVHALPLTDTMPPTVTASPNGGSFSRAQEVTLEADENGSEIYYTTDGSAVVMPGSGVSDSATLYTEPILIEQTALLRFVAFDPSGNASDTGEADFTITNDPVPEAPVITGDPVAGVGSVTLNWSVPDPGAAGLAITGYLVQAYSADGVAVGGVRSVPGDATSLVYDGLAVDTAYQFTVSAGNVNGFGPVSPKSSPVTVLGELVANAGPDQVVERRVSATTVTLDGTRSTAGGATYLWQQVLSGPTDPNAVTLANAETASPSFSLPVFRTPMTNSPLTFRLTVTSEAGTRTDTVSVTPVPDRVTVSLAQWRAGDLRIGGTSSVVGSTITVHRGSATGPVLGQIAVTAAAAPQTGGVFSLRLRNAAAGTSNPGTIWIESTVGGTAGPITVVNK
ncbi:fibronectin type III domain-containing protein [Arthrobacter sp. H20]|uniref:fibronectin type III domain-containing protein n=1 Tax=Arthrobacter sp. H20 TaxID=1267981 RepID=UPI0004B28258|nr:fibronectin type III domain-containing protein [Arthrobacter sp. H20]